MDVVRFIRRQMGKPSRWWRRQQALRSSVLFDGDDEMFKEAALSCQVFGEYGIGQSTVWVSRNTRARMFSVDTSRSWMNQARRHMRRRRDATLSWIDLGALGYWGYPLGDVEPSRVIEYAETLWHFDVKPDLVLIDGRYRVVCFLTCLLRAEPGTVLVMDDYTDRPEYHVIERFVSPARECGRQALFLRPDSLPSDEIEELRSSFLDVKV